MKNKTVGVQTFWRSQFNYGQLLQGYALQKFLVSNGYYSYIIRFDSFLSRMKELMILMFKGKIFTDFKQKKLRKFDEFRNKYIKYSEKKYKSFRALKKYPPKADIYIVGSDQVWAYMRNKERRDAYLLSFGETTVKKIAYAASFGRDNLKDDVEDFRYALKHFSYLGIREKSGQSICQNLGYDASWVTDPVTLLSPDYWRSLKTSININNEKQNIFFYTLTNVQQNRKYKELKYFLQKKYSVYYTNSSELLDESCKLFLSPKEWLTYIDECNAIVTDSFHCTMFCIMFNKTFVTIVRGDGKGMSNRLTSMLERLGLSERYVQCDNQKVEMLLEQNIDWSTVNYKLSDWVSYSKQQLLEALKK